MKIRTKLYLLSLSLIFALLLSGTYGIYGSLKGQELTRSLLKQGNSQYYLKDLQYLITGYSNDERAYLLKGDKKYLQEMQAKKRNMELVATNSSKYLTKMEYRHLKDALKEYWAFSFKVESAYKKNKKELANNIHFEEERKQRKEVLDPILDSIQFKVDRNIQLANEESKKQTALYNKIFIAILAVLIVAAGILTFITSKSILKPIQMVSERLNEMSKGEGDLTQVINLRSKDEIGILASGFDQFMATLRSLIKAVSINAERVADTSEQLSASAEQTSAATEQISSSLQEVANGGEHQLRTVDVSVNAIEETYEKTFLISSETKETAEIMEYAIERAGEGESYVHETVLQMKQIKQSVMTTGDKLQVLNSHSHSIGQIIRFISDIAVQTNLLSLNASIEAARAGEQGSGFTVVAQEIRKLSEKSRNSAASIRELISKVQEEIEGSMQCILTVQEDVDRGMQVTEKSEEKFAAIQGSVGSVREKMNIVADATTLLYQNAEDVKEHIKRVKIVAEASADGTQTIAASTEEQLASVQEVFASSQSLSMMAEDLKRLIGRFKV